MQKESLDSILKRIFEERCLILAVLSSPRKKQESQKLTLRPLLIQGQLCYQATEMRGQKALHYNLSAQECASALKEQFAHFKQGIFYTSEADYHILINKKHQATILQKPPSKSGNSLSLTHNRAKQYLLPEGMPIPFLVSLGIMNAQGKVLAQKMDKFRQINRFVEMIDDVLPHLAQDRPLHIIDFGCGKAYLTFALYHYLKFSQKRQVNVIGLDLKQDVIQHCQQLAEELGYEDLQFLLGDINRYETAQPVDLVVSLHACDTATDAALEKAIRWQAQAILCVPCCQHELFKQVRNPDLAPLLDHGILKERFAALATDAARSQLLEALGYHTQVMEFIDLEHTPKNLLIRAIRRSKDIDSEQALKKYAAFKQALQIHPSLERRFQAELGLPS
ncbi:class I SAM-dependent methyltransferase [Candidatus Protochlamydia phocaeensis]|uniref:class I SAM-dependent methyltransferase n=1 Tax=Candidatus Protochlamydia phocaeensis TaxID=1414722 RepID=UPI000838F00A|nr:SAM-dependent methyltransferase [Candidatus Protochlamydia phocaeensis]